MDGCGLVHVVATAVINIVPHLCCPTDSMDSMLPVLYNTACFLYCITQLICCCRWYLTRRTSL